MKHPIQRGADAGPGMTRSTIAFEGFIGEMNEDKVVIFPRLDRRYSIEIRRSDVLDFEAGSATGACRFVLPAHARVQERVTVMTTAMRHRSASDVSYRDALYAAEKSELGGWTQETDWERPA